LTSGIARASGADARRFQLEISVFGGIITRGERIVALYHAT
jgi:hypothetical protein